MIRRPPRSTLFPYTTLFRSFILVIVILGFVHFDLGLSPNDAAPFVRFTEQLQRGLRMSRIAFDAQHFGNEDRKSTRLNSSHSQISYAVFCLKKKKNTYIALSTAIILIPSSSRSTSSVSDTHDFSPCTLL